MTSITFPQQNLELAKDQPEYNTLNVFVESHEVMHVTADGKGMAGNGSTEAAKKVVPWSMTACFELSDEEIEEIIQTRKIWYKQMLFGNQFHPMMLMAKSPFEK